MKTVRFLLIVTIWGLSILAVSIAVHSTYKAATGSFP